ncbi:protein of unknown function [Rhodovastum atsumiense]|nr:protein of unknown function [Rhodovastum atsumiense]
MTDYDGLRAALMAKWSDGQVKGTINRLKIPECQILGCVRLDLRAGHFVRCTEKIT